MALATSALIAAGTAAATAYLDAKLHVRKDVKTLYNTIAAERAFKKAGEADRSSLWYIFEEQVQRLPPTERCIWSRTGIYTWQETYRLAIQYAQFFLSTGVKSGGLVAFYLQNHPEFMFATLGSWAIGSAPAMINYNLGGDALIHCLKVGGAKVLIVDEDDQCRARIEEVRDRIENEVGMTIYILDSGLKNQIASFPVTRPDDSYRKGIKATSPMCLLYTSGSTGFPKACSFPIQRAAGLTGPRVHIIGLKPGPNGDSWYNCMPLYHGTAFTTATSCLIGGLTLCIGKKFSTSRFWDDVRDSDSTAFVYVGETARYLLAVPPSEKDKQHKVKMMFGNGLRPDVWRRFSERFGIGNVSEFFNSTEGVFGLLNVCKGPYLQTAVGHHGALLRLILRNTFIPVKVDLETDAIWRDPKTGFAQRNKYEEGGEIIVAVPNEQAFAGYWDNPEATSKKFERDVFKKGDLYYRSGDALRRTTDGRWFFMDRLGDTYRWKSENVATAEVAEVLGHYPGVVEAAVYGVLVPGHDGRAGCAAIHVEPQLKDTFDYNAFLAYAHEKLPKYAVPVFLRVISDLSPLHNNKQNKVPLKKEGIDLDLIAAKSNDRMLWSPFALGHASAKTDGFVDFTKQDAEALKANVSAPTAQL